MGSLNTHSAYSNLQRVAITWEMGTGLTRKPEWVLDTEKKREKRKVIQQRGHSIKGRVDDDGRESSLDALESDRQPRGVRRKTDRGEQRIIREHGWVKECEQSEEDGAQKKLI